MIWNVSREPYLKRIPTVIDRTYGIQAYDVDNLYPQRADEVRRRSYTTKSAVEAIQEFIDGEGFEDQVLANLILNSEGQTANDILDLIAQDKAPYNGFALHFKYNPFTFRIMEVTQIEFMYCRFGLPDQNGNVVDIKYCTNWERDSSKTVNQVFEIFTYPVFNPDPTVVKAQIDEYGWEGYPGQVWFWTPKPGVYPSAPFDAVFDQAQSQSEIGVYGLSSIQNNFGVEKIFKYPGEFEDQTEADAFKRKLNEHKGAKGAKSTMVVEVPDERSVSLIENIQMQNTDKMFEFTSKDVKNSIRESMAIPAEVLGQLPETGMFNKQQIQDAYDYMNAKTSNHRNQISRVFKKIMAFWKDPVTINSFSIITQKYMGQAAGATTSQTGAPSGQTAPGQTAVERPQINEAMSKLSATQDRQLQRIINQFDSGKLTFERALSKIKMTFPLTEDEAKALLGD